MVIYGCYANSLGSGIGKTLAVSRAVASGEFEFIIACRVWGGVVGVQKSGTWMADERYCSGRETLGYLMNESVGA